VQIANEVLEPARAVRVAAFLFVEGNRADQTLGRELRLFERHAGVQVVLDFALVVIAEFVLELGFSEATPEQPSSRAAEFRKPPHISS
jgi:hypothetical protein